MNRRSWSDRRYNVCASPRQFGCRHVGTDTLGMAVVGRINLPRRRGNPVAILREAVDWAIDTTVFTGDGS